MSEPNWLQIARSQIGQKEISGTKDNPEIMKYYKAARNPQVKHDETAWCSAFANWTMKSAGFAPTYSLLARSWMKWGKACTPTLGAIMVFKRLVNGKDDGVHGHVAFYVGETPTHYRVLGGNQSDSVSTALIPKGRLLGARWPVTVKGASSVRGLGASVATMTSAGAIQPVMDGLSNMSPTLEMLSAYAPYMMYGVLGIGVITALWALYSRIHNINDTSYDVTPLEDTEDVELDLSEPVSG